jgi:hypothetical protein
MVKSALSFALVIAGAASASAQDYLLPTYVSGAGEINISAELRYQVGEGTLSNPAFEVDFEDTHVLGLFRASVGIGGGFEIEASAPFEFTGKGEADEGGVEFDVETAGLGDLTLEGTSCLVSKEGPGPRASIIVLPSGNATSPRRDPVGGVQGPQARKASAGRSRSAQFGAARVRRTSRRRARPLDGRTSPEIDPPRLQSCS